jgi:hypothetical protein
MLPSDVSPEIPDHELARRVKTYGDNNAITEIINRHTGVYLSVVKNFSLPAIEKNDLLDQKNTNIYNYVMSYDESRGMKLSSFIYMRAKYECMGVKEDAIETSEIEESNIVGSHTFNDDENVKNTTLQIARNVGGYEFAKIVEARHFGDETNRVSWHKIPEILGYGSHERARNLYLSHVERFKTEIKKEFNYIKL